MDFAQIEADILAWARPEGWGASPLEVSHTLTHSLTRLQCMLCNKMYVSLLTYSLTCISCVCGRATP
jgi:hypothetical protein